MGEQSDFSWHARSRSTSKGSITLATPQTPWLNVEDAEARGVTGKRAPLKDRI